MYSGEILLPVDPSVIDDVKIIAVGQGIRSLVPLCELTPMVPN